MRQRSQCESLVNVHHAWQENIDSAAAGDIHSKVYDQRQEFQS